MSEKTGTDEMFEMFQRMVNPMAFPMQGLLMGGLKIEDIDKKISELNTVRHWLNTNLGMLDLTIKTLEYQKALLAPAKPGEETKPGSENPLANPALWPWNFLNPAAAPAPKGTPEAQKKSRGKT